MFNKVNEQQFEAGDRVAIVSGAMEGTTGVIRRKKATPGDDRWIVDYDGRRNEAGFHSPSELQYIQ